MWCKSGWERSFTLSEDGANIIASYPGFNLIPLDSNEETVIIRFYDSNGLVSTIKLGTLFPGLAGLKRTVSHYHWGEVVGVNREGRVVVRLVDGRRLQFSMPDGRLFSPDCT